MNVEIGAVAAQFLFWEYLFLIFGIVSLQCSSRLRLCTSCTFARAHRAIAGTLSAAADDVTQRNTTNPGF
jgi:hypothetical protein